MNTTQAMKSETVTVFLRDGGTASLTADAVKVRNLNLDGATVHPFCRPGDNSLTLFILQDGAGNNFISENNNIGISMPHYIMGAKNRFGYRTDNILDVRMSNFISTKDRQKLR